VATRPARNEWNAWIVYDLVLWQARQRVFEVVGPYDTVSVNLSRGVQSGFRGALSVAAFDASGQADSRARLMAGRRLAWRSQSSCWASRSGAIAFTPH
jgi:hypothetical protein